VIFRVEPGGAVDLEAIPTGAPDDADKRETKDAADALVDELADLQLRLWAESKRSLLVVLQAMDAGGKDGTIRKVFTGLNPQGVRVTSFKEPTEEELAHDFLWRIHRHAPRAGEIVIFNRSHYEDVLVVRVEELVGEHLWRDRYRQIRDFEHTLTAAGTDIVKLYLHISAEEQEHRFDKRRDKPEKRWKWKESDLEAQSKWKAYRSAYEDALAETSTDEAPWYVVPADDKWYRNWLVRSILLERLRAVDPQIPG
jgi:PPK2 family polyphosphate:nucleotide phosphotransferase